MVVKRLFKLCEALHSGPFPPTVPPLPGYSPGQLNIISCTQLNPGKKGMLPMKPTFSQAKLWLPLGKTEFVLA